MDSKHWDNISKDYYSEILSPIRDGENNLLLNDISRFSNKKFVVADAGCGVGELIPLLSDSFKEVYAIDFSKDMIRLAKNNNKGFRNVHFFNNDISKMEQFHNSFDVLVSVNSVLSPDLNSVDIIFKEFFNCLKDHGIFLCVLPSMEVYAFESMLIAEEELKKNKEEGVKNKVRRFIKKKEHDFLFGMTNFDGLQKAFYRFEIFWRLRKAGFRDIKVSRINYSWEKFELAGQKAFPNERMLPWDWYVTAKK